MAIRLLALDLDGTLLDSRGRISERNRLAIDNAREQGVRVALVTGRRFRDSRPVALELGLDIPLISHNGALTKHAETLQTVSVLPLPLAAAREALRIGRDAGADALLSDDYEGLGVLVYDHLHADNTAAHRYLAWARRIHGDEEGGNAVQQVSALEEYLDHEPIHLAFSGRCAAMDQLEEILHAELGLEREDPWNEVSRTGFHFIGRRESGSVKRRGSRRGSSGIGDRSRRDHGDWRQLQRSRNAALRGQRCGDGKRSAFVA